MLYPIRASSSGAVDFEYKKLFTLTPYGLKNSFGYRSFLLATVPTKELSAPFPHPLAASSYNCEGNILIELSRFLKICSESYLGVMMSGKWPHKVNQAYSAAQHALCDFEVSQRSVAQMSNKLHKSASQIENAPQENWDNLFAELMLGQEACAKLAGVTFTPYGKVTSDHVIYDRPEMFYHLNMLHKTIFENIDPQVGVDEESLNKTYKRVLGEL